MDNPFDASQRELDMISLAVLVFLPAAFAAVLLVVPARWKEVMRWLALIATAATLTLGLCRLVDYYFLMDLHSDRSVRSFYHPATRLDNRSDQQMSDAAQAVPKTYVSNDLVTRRPWIGRFDIDFAL